MKSIFRLFVLTVASVAFICSCGNHISRPQSIEGESLVSPDSHLKLVFALAEDGTPMYSLCKDSIKVVLPSKLGFELFEKDLNLRSGFSVKEVKCDTFDEVWVCASA